MQIVTKSKQQVIKEAYGEEAFSKYLPDENGWSIGSRDHWGWGNYDSKVLGPGVVAFRPKSLSEIEQRETVYGFGAQTVVGVRLTKQGIETLANHHALINQRVTGTRNNGEQLTYWTNKSRENDGVMLFTMSELFSIFHHSPFSKLFQGGEIFIGRPELNKK